MSFAPIASTALPAGNPWTRILSALELKVNRQSFHTWLKPTRFSHSNGRTLFVRIPSTQFQHIGDRYADLIHEAIENQQLDVDEVRFVTLADDPAAPKSREDGGFAPLPAHSPNAPQPPRLQGFARRLPDPHQSSAGSIGIPLRNSIACTSSKISSSVLAISLRMRPRAPLRSGHPRLTIRSSCTAASAWARRT